MRLVHWQDVLSCTVGAWLCISPLVLSLGGLAAWATLAFGLLVMVFAVEGLILPSYLEEWVEIVMGLALVIAPWSMSYGSSAAAYNSTISGIAVIVLAAWEMATDGEFLTWWSQRKMRMRA
jgi:SPW repeat